MAVAPEDKDSPGGHAIAALSNEPRFGLEVERPCPSNVKPKLHCSRNLVDILSPWAGSANQFEDQLSAALL
jgi:hypothetical protein